MKNKIVLGLTISTLILVANISATRFTCTGSFTTDQKIEIQQACMDMQGAGKEESEGVLACDANLDQGMKLHDACMKIKGRPGLGYQPATN